MASDHERGSEKNEFCGIPGTPCKCGNNYRTICAGTAAGWADFTFPRWVKAENPFAFDKEYEAHHVLCVKCVSEEIIGNDDLDLLVRKTKWCINKESNMLAMPLWGHTVMWYCTIDEDGGEVEEEQGPPGFADIPQHDWDHNHAGRYTEEITNALKKLAGKMKEQGHKATAAKLTAALDAQSKEWVAELKDRGERSGGTHHAWTEMEKTGKEWCKPFSMANDGFISSKSFPTKKFDAKLKKTIDRIARALRG